jgi:hypothetical protein
MTLLSVESRDDGGRQLESGHSGYSLTLLEGARVRKSVTKTDHAAYDRLRRQCAKQRQFGITDARFKACEVLDELEDEHAYAFVMPFYHSRTAVEFVDHAGPRACGQLFEAIEGLLHAFRRASVPTGIDRQQLEEKAQATIEQIGRTAWSADAMPACRALEERIGRLPGTIEIPVGLCHGDLTLANVLFTIRQQKYVLVDFLDSFIETPIADLAKLRQEHRLGWSSLVSRVPHDRKKYQIVMREMARHDGRWARALAVDPEIADVFEFLNVARVMQYAREDRIAIPLLRYFDSLARGKTE